MTAGGAHWGTEDEPESAGSSGGAHESVTQLGGDVLLRASAIEIARGALLAGRYQIEASLGKGGSGIVLRAFDRVARVPVAVKILKPELATDPRWIERFSRELRLARQIQHPNVCRVFDIGQADGHWFITMELATGGTLRDELGPAAKARPIGERLADVRAVVEGLAAIHGAGIVHRDVKPDNFLRLDDGRLVLSDFGLATNPADAPAVSILVGTPHYMAPEVVMGEVATPRSDVWSAAVVVHEILFGERPSRRSVERDSLRSIASGVEAALWGACETALADEPEDRPENASALLAIVDAAAAGRKPRRPRSTRPSRTSARTALWGATALAVGLGIVTSRHLWRPVEASSATLARRPQPINVTGAPRDWSVGSELIAKIDGRVHCTAMLPGGESIRVVWGSPRRAEDIDIATGRRSASRVAPETFQVDCPQLSPSGKYLLYTRVPRGGSPEIVRSMPDGSRGVDLTNGTEPIWLPNGEEFVFDADTSHVGIYSLPAMNYTLMPDGSVGSKRHLYKKAVSPTGDAVSALFIGDALDRNVDVYSVPELTVAASWDVPISISDVQFLGRDVLLADRAEGSSIDRLDWSTGTARRAGYLGGRSLQSAISAAGGQTILTSRTARSDVWIFDPGKSARPLTHDGRSYAPSWSPTGDVLVERPIDNSRVVVEVVKPDGSSERLTTGPADFVPSYSADGSSWAYADYNARSIVYCRGRSCSALPKEAALPSWPRVSPDGTTIAFVAETGSPRLYVVKHDGTARRDLGPTAYECPPVWTSARSLWSFSGAGSERRWEEIDVATGTKTGRSKLAGAFNENEGNCGLDSEPADSAFYQRARAVAVEDWELRRSRDVHVP